MDGQLTTQLVCHRDDKDEIIGGREGCSAGDSGKTAVIHRVTYTKALAGLLKTNHYLLETQPTQPDHSNLLLWCRSVFKR